MRGFLILATFFALLTGCGGGGGGAPASSSTVSLVSVSPALVEGQIYEGMSPPGVTFRVYFDGNIQTLNGKTIYAFVEIGSAPFQTGFAPNRIDTVNKYVEVTLTGSPAVKLTEGITQGNMRVLACLDAGCTAQLGNSPFQVPYKITVLPGIKLSPGTVTFSTLFGTVPAPVRVSVDLPKTAISWELLSPPQTYSFPALKAADGSPNIDFTPQLALPGNYSASYFVRANMPLFSGAAGYAQLSKTLTASYEVKPNPALLIAFDPPNGSHSFVVNAVEQRRGTPQILTQDGTFTSLGNVYFSSPTAAAGFPNEHAWLSSQETGRINEYFVIPCGTSPLTPTCLPTGMYSAAVRFRHTSGAGVVTNVDYPVQMNIRP